MKQFISRNNIRIASCVAVNENPNAPDWKDAHHYKVCLVAGPSRTRRQMTVYYSMGYGYDRGPEAVEIIDCLVSDAVDTEARSFEQWCSDYGYDKDSRKAEITFKACVKSAVKLKRFIGDAYQTLLYDTERL